MASRACVLVLAAAALGCAARQPVDEAPAAERPPVEVRAAVDRAVATTGDVITYTVRVDAAAGLEVEVPEPGSEIAGFRIFDLGRAEPVERGGRRLEERWYKLRADLVGSYVLPPVAVRYRAADGAVDGWQTTETSAIFVEVESVLPADGEAADIRGLKPLRPPADRWPWPWLIAALALIGLAAAAWWWWRRRPHPVAPAAPPHEIAFAGLDALRGTDFDDPEAVRRFHFRISVVVRSYVEGRFGLNATDLTTEEIVARLDRAAGLGSAEAAELRRFLADTDRVKFAHHRPGRDEIESTYERALGFVEATRERPVAPSELREAA